MFAVGSASAATIAAGSVTPGIVTTRHDPRIRPANRAVRDWGKG